jgi:hypothetical protein
MKTLTSRERVMTTLARSVPDRVPINYCANDAIDGRLKAHFGLKADDGEGLRQALHIDFRSVGPRYIGRKRHQDIPHRGVKVDEWGIHRVWVEHSSGGYWDYCDFPLQNAMEDEVAAWPMLSPDDFDYGSVLPDCRQAGDYALHVGHAGIGDIINSNGMLRGMEQTLIDLVTDEPAGLLLAKRRTDIQLEITRRTLEAARGRVDFLWMGEDLGTQRGPTISMEVYRRQIQPLHQKFVDLAKSFNIPVIIHTCGSSSWAYHEFIRMGINAVDTLQPEAADMAPAYLKKTFGDRLAFHGCISTAGPVANGTVQETIAHCRETLDIMMPGGGYCFAPTHALQDNSPTENVLAMYDTAMRCGRYS